ncbi:hypothetical protein INT45_005194, partial [Circinella minor]
NTTMDIPSGSYEVKILNHKEEDETKKVPKNIIDPIIERRLLKNLDSRLLIWTCLACFAKKLDRNNLLLWGAIVTLMTFVQNYKQLYGLRFCIGVFEAPFHPGMIFLLSSWYTKKVLEKRVMLFITGDMASGAFGGLLAGEIHKMTHGVSGLPSWKFLFIIEGLIAVILGVSGYFLLPNYPENTSWLTFEEREVAILRVQTQERGQSSLVTKFS